MDNFQVTLILFWNSNVVLLKVVVHDIVTLDDGKWRKVVGNSKVCEDLASLSKALIVYVMTYCKIICTPFIFSCFQKDAGLPSKFKTTKIGVNLKHLGRYSVWSLTVRTIRLMDLERLRHLGWSKKLTVSNSWILSQTVSSWLFAVFRSAAELRIFLKFYHFQFYIHLNSSFRNLTLISICLTMFSVHLT